MEQNLGNSVVGDQKTGWLFRHTQKLRKFGVKLTYSGDTPFLLKLITRHAVDTANICPTDVALYFDMAKKPLPTDCDTRESTPFRQTYEPLPFIEGCPHTSLVSFKDIRCVVPDVSHMIPRCVESDLRKVVDKIIDESEGKYASRPLLRLQANLSSREAKKPYFEFATAIKPGDIVKSVGAIKLSGTGALTVIADKEELESMNPDITDLYDGVFSGSPVVHGPSTTNAGIALKILHPELFNKTLPAPNDGELYMSIKDACELLRKSLNRCARILRNSNEGFDILEFEKWAETYYQVSIFLFTDKGLTPYKLKIMLYPALVRSGYIKNPWEHMCEGMEKSNHHAHGNFHSKTLRGGGTLHHQDPLFLECFFLICPCIFFVCQRDGSIIKDTGSSFWTSATTSTGHASTSTRHKQAKATQASH